MSVIDDPFLAVKEDVTRSLKNTKNLFERFCEISSTASPTATRQEREWLCTELRNSLRSVEWDLEDLDETLGIIEKNPKKFDITAQELINRHYLINESRNTIKEIRDKMAASDNRFKERNFFADTIHSPLAKPQYKYSKLENESDSSSRFVQESLERQQLIIANQDQNLDRIGDSVHVLKDMSSKIGNELDEHTIMLEEIDREMHQTETKLDSVTRKLAKMTHLSNDKRQCYAILVLIGILFIVILLLIILG